MNLCTKPEQTGGLGFLFLQLQSKTSQPFKGSCWNISETSQRHLFSQETPTMLLDKVDIDFIPVDLTCVTVYMMITQIDLQ